MPDRNAPQSERIGKCRSLATEAAIGLIVARDKQDSFGVKLLLRAYSEDAHALGIQQDRAQSLLSSAVTALAVTAYRNLAEARGVSMQDVLQSEAIRVSAWADGAR